MPLSTHPSSKITQTSLHAQVLVQYFNFMAHPRWNGALHSAASQRCHHENVLQEAPQTSFHEARRCSERGVLLTTSSCLDSTSSTVDMDIHDPSRRNRPHFWSGGANHPIAVQQSTTTSDITVCVTPCWDLVRRLDHHEKSVLEPDHTDKE